MSTARLTGAACALPVNVGLPWISENPSASAQAQMLRVCASCPVAAACAREAVRKETTAGFWAGADLTMWREVSTSDLFEELSDFVDETPTTGLPVQGTFDLPGLEVAA
ncbi:WhiB family transcriptional regulator [Promicromonospora panici]|uniref:WhiB family transcriptional regulator n=1 Tax=Promicromonospora panici TaxID=2219658 RepID=UPI00101DDAF9|nr:WhiB family transcriptional regulator [Promicromonospora panici]